MGMIFNSGIAMTPGLVALIEGGETPPPWYDANWTYRKKITVDADKVSQDFHNQIYGQVDVPAGSGHEVFDLEASNFYVWDPQVYLVDGTYYLLYTRWPHSSGFDTGWITDAEICLATSSDPTGPFTHHAVILQAAGGAVWDSHSVINNTLVQDGDDWLLYYVGLDSTGVNSQQIGVARSTTGIDGTYTRGSNNPIVAQGAPTAWDGDNASAPAALVDGGTYKVWYKGRGNSVSHRKIGLATASAWDGPYTKHASNPLINFGSTVGPEGPFVWKEAGRYNMLLKDQEGTHVAAFDTLWLWSNDGITWTEPTTVSYDAFEMDWWDPDADRMDNISLYFDARGYRKYMYGAKRTPDGGGDYLTAISYGEFPDPDLTDFPLLINITDTDLRDEARSDAFDIVFTASDGQTELKYEREYWDDTTGDLVAWIKTALSASVDTAIYMYYGNAAQATDKQDAQNVWDANFQAVWHLSEDPSGGAPQMIDSTSHGKDGTSAGSMTSGDLNASSLIDGGIDFDGSNDIITFPAMDALGYGGVSGEAWVNINTKAAGEHWILDYIQSDVGAEGQWGLQFDGDDDEFQLKMKDTGLGAYKVLQSTFVPAAGTWYYLAFSYNGNVAKVNVNNRVFIAKPVLHGAAADQGSAIGAFPTGAAFFFGTLDEARISNANRSTNYFNTAFYNYKTPGSFYSVGSEETQ